MALEQFIGFDQGEGMSESAFEAFKDQMKAAAAQIAAIKKEEGKQKKKEEELLKILLKFVKTSSKTELVLLLSRVLEQNIPANFILSIILLGNEDIQQSVGQFIMLPKTIPGDNSAHADSTASSGTDSTPDSGHALTFFKANDDSLPLKIKIELDHWIKNMLFQAQENPQKLIKTAYLIEVFELPKEYDFEDPKYEEKRSTKKVLIQLITYILQDFLKQNQPKPASNPEETDSEEESSTLEPYEKLYAFSTFIIEGILHKVEESLDTRKLLK